MRISIYFSLAAAFMLSFIAVPLSRRLAPRPAAHVLAGAAVTAGLIWVGALSLLAMATLGRLGVVDQLGHWSNAVLNSHAPVPPITGIGSVVLLVLVAGSLSLAAVRLCRGLLQLKRLRSSVSAHRCGDLAVIDCAEPEALAVPGRPGSIVVTSGMLRVLDPAEQAVLFAHERSHLRSAHWAFRLATRLGAALLPVATPLVGAGDQALERWADEAAAAQVGDRQLVARSLAKAALASTDYRRNALSPAFAEGAVVERVNALLQPQRASRWALSAAPLLIAAFGAATLLEASRELDHLFDLAKLL